MNRRWLYPYYVIVVLLLIMWLTGCNSQTGRPQASKPFSDEVRVEAGDGLRQTLGWKPCRFTPFSSSL